MIYLNKEKYRCGNLHFPNKISYYGQIIYDKLNGKREIPDDIFQGLYVLDFYDYQGFINHLLKIKDVVILDRYFYSTLAYSNYYNTFFEIEKVIGQLKEPDLVFYLKIPAEIAIKRLEGINKKDEHESNVELLTKTLEGYDKISKAYNFIILDGTVNIKKNIKKVITIFNDNKEKKNG
jgi:thymidylate kinase